MNPIAYLIAALWIGLLILPACTSETPIAPPAPVTRSAIQPPVPALDPPLDSIAFLAEAGLDWTAPSGSTLTIPPAALVDSADQPVAGPVVARYREMHDAYDIFLAGIPMAHAGSHFSTAGSFQLLVTQNGQPLQLRDSQRVAVRMVSYVGGEAYKFYRIDEVTGRWSDLGTRAPEINEERQKLQRRIRRLQPALRFPLTRQYMAFNYQAILDVLPGGKGATAQHEAINGKLEKYGLGWTKAEIHQRIKWKGQEVHASLMVWKNPQKKTFPEWTAGRYGRMTHLKGDRYRYQVAAKDSTELFSVELEAMMTLKELFAFPPEKWSGDYRATMARIEKERAHLRTMAEVYRSFELDEFGLYNWDRLIKEAEAIPLVAEFAFDRPWVSIFDEPVINYISCDGRCLIRYPRADWAKFRLMPGQEGALFSLFPGRELQVLTAENLAKIEKTVSGSGALPTTHRFELYYNGTFNSREELMERLRARQHLSKLRRKGAKQRKL